MLFTKKKYIKIIFFYFKKFIFNIKTIKIYNFFLIKLTHLYFYRNIKLWLIDATLIHYKHSLASKKWRARPIPIRANKPWRVAGV
jgi:hypothetical protein